MSTKKVAVVTGAGGVLCSEFAKLLSQMGYKIALLDLNEAAAAKVADDINKAGGTAKAFGVNVLESESLEAARQAINASLGSCDVLINGAGGNSPKCTTDNEFHEDGDLGKLKTFFDLDKSGFQFVFDLNIIGTLLPTQCFVKDMLGKQGCSVINISSMNAFTPLTKIPAYSAAKAGVSNLTQWLAVHFAKQGIRVNAIAPGFFVTAQNKQLLFDSEGNPTPRTEKILAATPMGRFGEASELLGTLKWLVDADASGFVTGTVIPVDGGFSAYSGV